MSSDVKGFLCVVLFFALVGSFVLCALFLSQDGCGHATRPLWCVR